jgi:hypothetical protein
MTYAIQDLPSTRTAAFSSPQTHIDRMRDFLDRVLRP